MQRAGVLSLSLKAVVLVILFWRLGHTVKGLMKEAVPASEVKWFGIDGIVLGLAGGILTSSGIVQTLGWAAAGGALFYGLASFGLNVEEDDGNPPTADS